MTALYIVRQALAMISRRLLGWSDSTYLGPLTQGESRTDSRSYRLEGNDDRPSDRSVVESIRQPSRKPYLYRIRRITFISLVYQERRDGGTKNSVFSAVFMRLYSFRMKQWRLDRREKNAVTRPFW